MYPVLLTPNDIENKMFPESIPKCSLALKKWRGAEIKESFGNKPFVDINGEGMFAELAIQKLFEKSGWSARWIETYGTPANAPKYLMEWKDIPFVNQKHFPISYQRITDILASISRCNNNTYSGAWDVLGWTDERLLFAEAKRKRQDKVRPSQVNWFNAAIKAGLKAENFLIVEWDYEEQ